MQSISYLPYFISTVVIVGLVKDFCSVDGVINGIREFFGLNAVSFMTDPKYFRTIFIASNIWQGLGWGAIVYLAALSGVDPQLHEAATLDGANRWQRIRYVSWPAIVPTTTIMLILESGKIISSDFTKVLLLIMNLPMRRQISSEPTSTEKVFWAENSSTRRPSAF